MDEDTRLRAMREKSFQYRLLKNGAEITGMIGEASVLRISEAPDGLSVVAVAPSAFQGRRALVEVELPQSLRTVGANAFAGCASLRRIALPENMDAIGASAFQGCSSLEAIELPRGLTQIEPRTFYGCASLRRVRIPEGVMSIGERAFAGCASLREVLLPEGLTAIASNAFADCASLRALRIPETVTDISADALPRGMLHGGMLFLPAQGLLVRAEVRQYSSLPGEPRRFDVPEGTGIIADRALAGNPNLQVVTFPRGLRRIGRYALEGCSSLRQVELPEGVEALGEGAFQDCVRLERASLSRGLKAIPDAAFCRCGSLGQIVWPDAPESIGERAFEACASLREVRLPDSVRSLGARAFYRCAGLERVELPAGLENVGDGALGACPALSEIALRGRYSPALFGLLSQARRAALIAPNDPPEAFPGLWRKRVCLGYARAAARGIAYAPEAEAAILRWMRGHGSAFVAEALGDASLMHLLADNDCLSLRDARLLLERAKGDSRNEYVMTLLDYCNRRSGGERAGDFELW